ncbi:MAG: PAS domain-containing protein, partial [Chthoniobacterales bacterium]
MHSPLRVLHLEDNLADTELVQARLEGEGIACEVTRVETDEDFVAALKRERFDLILADYTLPSFDGLSALRIAHQHTPNVPFIFVSGTLGEDVAIEALKTGAVDYVLKTRLARLAPSVMRALREGQEKAERQRAEEELKREQQRFMDMVNSVGGIVWEADAETFAFTFVSQEAKRLLGYAVEQWLQEPTFWKDHLHPDDRDWAVQFCVNATAEKRSHDFEYRMIAADGGIVWFRDVVTVVVEGGRPTRLRGVMVDTTDRKRAEDAARRSEKELRDLIETMPTMAFSTRADGSSKFVSPSWSEYTGLSPESTSDPEWESTVHPDDLNLHRSKWQASLASGEPFENEVRHRSATDEYRWFLVRAVPLRDAHGQILKWYGTLTDIEDRKRAEDGLRRSEAYLAEAQKLTLTGNWAWDPRADKMLYCSDELFRIYEMDRKEDLPAIEDFLQRVHPEDRDRIKERSVNGALDGIEHGADYRLLLPDGRIKHVLSIRQSISNEAGEVVEVLGTLMDISEGKRAEALFAGEMRLLEMIATGVALKEILNALCIIIEEYRGGTLASILLLRPDGQHLDSVASPSLPKSWRQEMERLPIGPCAGSCGTAAYRGSAVIVSDIATDPLWEVPEHRAAALQHGLRASWSNPILSSDGKVLGTFCIYGRERQSPSLRDLELIEKATYLARVAIERDRAEEALRSSEGRYRTFVDFAADAFMLHRGEDGTILDVNQQACDSLGYTREELIGMPVKHFDAGVALDAVFMEDLMKRINARETVGFETSHRRKDGT